MKSSGEPYILYDLRVSVWLTRTKLSSLTSIFFLKKNNDFHWTMGYGREEVNIPAKRLPCLQSGLIGITASAGVIGNRSQATTLDTL